MMRVRLRTLLVAVIAVGLALGMVVMDECRRVNDYYFPKKTSTPAPP
jgi:hypothetical protein